MIKSLLPITLACLMTAPAFALAPRKVVTTSPLLEAYTGTVEKGKKLPAKAEEADNNDDEQQKSIDFTLAGEVYNALKLNNATTGTEIYLAFEMSTENTEIFANDEITSVNITSGVTTLGTSQTNKVNDVTIFIIEEDQENAPVYTQSATLGSKPWTEYKITLDTPYKITPGKNFYVGYSFAIPDANTYYLATDYMLPETIDGCWVGVMNNGKVSWNNLADQIGTLCIGCTITGENFPMNNVSLVQLVGTPYVEPGVPFYYQFLVKNKGFSASSLEMTYTIGDGEPQVYGLTLEEPIGYNQYGLIDVPLICNEEKTGVKMNFTLSKVDDEDNTASNKSLTGLIDCFSADKGFTRTHVIEEGTGTWCGWCPRGIVMMEYVAETYPDLFARIAIHAGSGSSRDVMQVPTGLVIINEYMPSFPSAMIDRFYDLEYMTSEEIDGYVDMYKDIPSIVEVSDLNGTVNDDNTLTVDTKVKFGMDMTNNDRYRLSYYLTEDGLGPYTQTNYYAGGGSGVMGGWEKKGSSVKTIYNDVCRYLLGEVSGLSNSIPVEIVADTEYEYTADLPMTALKMADFYLTAFIVDNTTGYIVNAKQIKLDNPNSGVEEVATDAAVVSRKYYSVSGVEVKEPVKGIYIVSTVHADGTVKTTKEIF